MAEAMYHVHTIACGYDERSDWAIQRYLNAEAESNYLLDRVILTDRGQLDQTYKYWVTITKLVESRTLDTNSSQPNDVLGETPGISERY